MHTPHLIHQWITPRSEDRDAAFRERVIRTTLPFIIILGLISFLLTVVAFQSSWGIISFPTLHIVAISLCLVSAVSTSRGHLLTAGWFMVFTVLFGAAGIVFLARRDGEIIRLLTGIPAFMFIPLVATLVLSTRHIIWVSLLSTLAYWLAQFGLSIETAEVIEIPALQQTATVGLLLLSEGVLLRQLRVEFDARLETLTKAIAEEEAARQRAEDARQRAEEADRAKTSFLANMSHELRTPLNAIIGYDEAMLGGMVGEFEPKQKELLGHIQKNSRRLLALINDVLDLSKIESGSIELYLAPMSPRKLMTETVENLQSLALEKGIGLETVIEPGVPEVILGDARKLEQIVVNLVGNAIKFTDQGQVTVKVGIDNSEMWHFSVADTGTGMMPDAVEYIFEPFRQADNSTTRRHRGTGLGLSITKRLVEKMGGKITVDTTLGKGSTFFVSLPRANVPTVEEEATIAEP